MHAGWSLFCVLRWATAKWVLYDHAVRRKLILLRHGEAPWPAPDQSDRERPLTEGGKQQVASVRVILANEGWIPEQIVTSPALRATTTANIIASSFKLTASRSEALYAGSLLEIQSELLGATDAAVQTLMLVGHNPTFSDLASVLCGMRVSLGTANAACMSIDEPTWPAAVLLDSAWKLDRHVVPA